MYSSELRISPLFSTMKLKVIKKPKHSWYKYLVNYKHYLH